MSKHTSKRSARKHANLERKQQPGYFCFRMDDSDGNDNHVADIIVEAVRYEHAVRRISDYLDDLCRTANHESDGMWGTLAPCDCEHADDCDPDVNCECEVSNGGCSHGGVTIDVDNPDTRKKFVTYEDARRGNGSIWHSQMFINIDGSVQ